MTRKIVWTCSTRWFFMCVCLVEVTFLWLGLVFSDGRLSSRQIFRVGMIPGQCWPALARYHIDTKCLVLCVGYSISCWYKRSPDKNQTRWQQCVNWPFIHLFSQGQQAVLCYIACVSSLCLAWKYCIPQTLFHAWFLARGLVQWWGLDHLRQDPICTVSWLFRGIAKFLLLLFLRLLGWWCCCCYHCCCFERWLLLL